VPRVALRCPSIRAGASFQKPLSDEKVMTVSVLVFDTLPEAFP
jgi:hypothetical protein